MVFGLSRSISSMMNGKLYPTRVLVLELEQYKQNLLRELEETSDLIALLQETLRLEKTGTKRTEIVPGYNDGIGF